MELTDIIALYAAVVSTLLVFNEIRRKSKILKIVIDYEFFSDTGYLKLINQSERPITIASVTMQLNEDRVPGSNMFVIDEETINFPYILDEYNSVQIKLIGQITNYIINKKAKNFSIKVFDIEGKVYSKYKIRGVDERWGDIYKDMFKR